MSTIDISTITPLNGVAPAVLLTAKAATDFLSLPHEDAFNLRIAAALYMKEDSEARDLAITCDTVSEFFDREKPARLNEELILFVKRTFPSHFVDFVKKYSILTTKELLTENTLYAIINGYPIDVVLGMITDEEDPKASLINTMLSFMPTNWHSLERTHLEYLYKVIVSLKTNEELEKFPYPSDVLLSVLENSIFYNVNRGVKINWLVKLISFERNKNPGNNGVIADLLVSIDRELELEERILIPENFAILKCNYLGLLLGSAAIDMGSYTNYRRDFAVTVLRELVDKTEGTHGLISEWWGDDSLRSLRLTNFIREVFELIFNGEYSDYGLSAIKDVVSLLVKTSFTYDSLLLTIDRFSKMYDNPQLRKYLPVEQDEFTFDDVLRNLLSPYLTDEIIKAQLEKNDVIAALSFLYLAERLGFGSLLIQRHERLPSIHSWRTLSYLHGYSRVIGCNEHIDFTRAEKFKIRLYELANFRPIVIRSGLMHI